MCVFVLELKDFLFKECLYLYTSREDPHGRPQSFDTDCLVPAPPKMKYRYTRIIHQWKNYIFSVRQSVQLLPAPVYYLHNQICYRLGYSA